MKITKIEAQKRKLDRVNIYIDDQFAFGLTDTLRYKYDLSSGKEVTQEFIDDILNAEEQNKVINHALKLLSYRQRSEKEIYDKLKEKGYDLDKIDNAIQYCIERNYINDKVFAETFIRDKMNINKLGSQRIKYELIGKGVSKDIIDQVLTPDYDVELEMAMELALKKMPSYKNDDYNAIYRKLGGYLQRRGYSFDIVRQVMNKVVDKDD